MGKKKSKEKKSNGEEEISAKSEGSEDGAKDKKDKKKIKNKVYEKEIGRASCRERV